MAETEYPSPFNMIAAAVMGASLCVKITAPRTVNLCGAGEGSSMIGTTEHAIDADMLAAGEYVAVRDRKDGGLVELVSAGDIAAGANIYCAANGKVDDAVSGNIIGTNAGDAVVGADKVVLVRLNCKD